MNHPILEVENNYIAFKVEMFDLLKTGSTTIVINKIAIDKQIDNFFLQLCLSLKNMKKFLLILLR